MVLSFEVRKNSCCFFVMSSPFPCCEVVDIRGCVLHTAVLQRRRRTTRRPPAADTDWVMGGQCDTERAHPRCVNVSVKTLSAEIGWSKGGCGTWGSRSRWVGRGKFSAVDRTGKWQVKTLEIENLSEK